MFDSIIRLINTVNIILIFKILFKNNKFKINIHIKDLFVFI